LSRSSSDFALGLASGRIPGEAGKNLWETNREGMGDPITGESPGTGVAKTRAILSQLPRYPDSKPLVADFILRDTQRGDTSNSGTIAMS
jgi:hypothetical protein